MIRGFALFGVLLVNMYNFGAYSDEWTGALDSFFFTVKHALFETKSWRLFSMLFGFGFFLQMRKSDAAGSRFMGFFVRRLAVLFLIGMGHALLYDGDILMKYAALGLLLLPFRRVPPRAILILVIALVAVFPVGNAIVSLTNNAPRSDAEEMQTLSERREDHPYLGSPIDIARANAEAIPPHIFSGLHNPESSLAIFAMFLLGLWVGRRGILEDLPQHWPLIRFLMLAGLIVGLGSTLLEQFLTWRWDYGVFRDHTAPIGVQIVGDSLFAFGSTALAIGYAATIVVLSQTGRCTWMLTQFGSLGRLALTVYLSGSLLFSTLFYGYGFGQLFLLGPAATTAFAVLFFCLQIAFCSWWTRRYRFGPIEWIWRSATYWHLQPNRLRSK
jgi:uncharacterized protein